MSFQGDPGSAGWGCNGDFSASNPPSTTLKFPNLGSWVIPKLGIWEFTPLQKKEEKEEKKEKKTLMGFKKHRVPYYGPQLNLCMKSITLQPSWVLKFIGFPSLRFPTVGPR